MEVFQTPEGKVHPGLIDEWEDRIDELREEGAYWTVQMENPDQLGGYDAMAGEILDQLGRFEGPPTGDEGELAFVKSVGTGGCAMGTSRGFARREEPVHVRLVEPAESPYLTKGEGGSHGVEGIAVLEHPPLLDEDRYDDAVAVPEAEGRETARKLAREEGLMVGVSSGLNVAAARTMARELEPQDTVVTILVDTGLKYLDGPLFAAEG